MSDGPVAIIGWGSLLWDLERLAPQVEGDWLRGAGPRLPIEFCRISPKRRGGLTLVLDAEHGAPCPTHVIRHRQEPAGGDALAQAKRDLAARERTPESRIGWATRETASRADAFGATVQAWLARSGFAAAVWTDLESNFHQVAGVPFTLAAAEAHLQRLAGEDRAEAVRYIHFAPEETQTPLRRYLLTRPWWGEALQYVL